MKRLLITTLMLATIIVAQTTGGAGNANEVKIPGILSVDEDVRFFPREQKALVSFIFDDGNDTDYTVMKPLFDGQGEVACTAVITEDIGVSGHTTSAELVILENAGWEIMSHTVTHANLIDSTDAVVRTELSDSKDALEALGLTVNNFVYPFGNHNETVRRITKEFYRSGRAGGNVLNPHILDTYELKARNADDHTLLATYQTLVDSAESQEKWLIFLLHGTTTDDSTAMNTLINYIQAKSIDIVTVNQALDLIGNIIDIGDNFAVGEKGVRVNGDISGFTINGNHPIEGYSTGRSVERISYIKIFPGATPNTNIDIDVNLSPYDHNQPTITDADDLAAGGSSGSFALSGGASIITMDITENVIAVKSVSIQRVDLNSSATTAWTIRGGHSSGNLVLSIYASGSDTALSWVGITDTGDAGVYFIVTYLTST